MPYAIRRYCAAFIARHLRKHYNGDADEHGRRLVVLLYRVKYLRIDIKHIERVETFTARHCMAMNVRSGLAVVEIYLYIIDIIRSSCISKCKRRTMHAVY